MSPHSHLVIGGSAGIGYAYAFRRAVERGTITLVARNPAGLRRAAARLRRAGAADVEVFSCDIADPEARGAMMRGLEGRKFGSVLLSGPSPPFGPLSSVDGVQIHTASEIALVYPLELARWALRGGVVKGGRFVVISSSAAVEPLCEHEFFLSALLRRSLETMLGCLEDAFVRSAVRLEVWRPRLVLTHAARRYARSLGANRPADVHRRLRQHFGFAPVAPAKFVRLCEEEHESL